MFKKDSLKITGKYRIVRRDKDGNILPLWQENALGSFILKHFAKDVRLPLVTGGMRLAYEKKNLVVNGGLAAIADLVGDVNTINPFTYIALGDDDTAASGSQTALQNELSSDGLGRAQGTVSLETTTTSNDTLQITKTFTFSGSTPTSIKEIGIFNASSSGTMLSRTVITTKMVDTSGETLEVTYQLVGANA